MQQEIARRIRKFIHCAIFGAGIAGSGFVMLNSFEGGGSADLLGLLPGAAGFTASVVALIWRLKSY